MWYTFEEPTKGGWPWLTCILRWVGRDSDVESLQDWLRSEPEFRGHLGQGETPGPEGAMGAVVDVIVGVVSSGAATTLAKSLQV